MDFDIFRIIILDFNSRIGPKPEVLDYIYIIYEYHIVINYILYVIKLTNILIYYTGGFFEVAFFETLITLLLLSYLDKIKK